jgi:ribonuclease D
MTVPMPLPVEIITNTAQLDGAVRKMLDSKAIAVDTESNSRHHYPEQLCLIQIATGNNVYIIDTIILKDIGPLQKVLADDAIMKIIHGADYDVRSIDRHCGFRIHNLYDTYIAARFAGITEVGLAALIRDLLSVNIVKSKRLQTADWGRRPLSNEAIEYAGSDVLYLRALQEILSKRLDVLGRTTWVAEEFARLEEVRYTAPDMENAFRSIKGAESLDGRGLAVLRSLFLFREQEALSRHRPTFFVMPDEILVALSTNRTADLAGFCGNEPPRFRADLQQALRDGLAAQPIQPMPRMHYEPMSPEQTRRLTSLKAWRTTIATKLALDPSLIWPMVSLQRLAKAPDTLDIEATCDNVRRWQNEQFTSALQTCLKTNA